MLFRSTTDDQDRGIRSVDGTRKKAAQTFQVGTTGPCPFIDIKGKQLGTVSGNAWLELYATSAGAPTGGVLATSDKIDASLISTSAQIIRFPFRNPVTLNSGTTYAWALTGDWTESDTNTIRLRENSAGGYGSGQNYVYNGSAWSVLSSGGTDFWFKTYITENDTAVTMPTGYTQKALIGYVDRKSTRLNSSHVSESRMPSSA